MKLAVLASALVLVAGCNSSSSSGSSSTQPSSITDESSNAAVPVAPNEVIAPRGESLEAADYSATIVPYRLFGTSKGDGLRGPSAVIANTKTWSTRTYHVGDTVGRGFKVASVDDRSVTLKGAALSITLQTNADSSVKFIAHRLDTAVVSLGKLTYGVDLAKAVELSPKLPTVTPVTIYGQAALQLGPIEAESLLDEADFKEGDFLVSIDATPVASDGAGQLQRALSSDSGSVAVRVVRNGVSFDRTYVKQ